MAASLTPDEYQRATVKVCALIADRRSIALASFTHELERVEPSLRDRLTLRAVAGILRKQGWFRGELVGHGLDREPLYKPRSPR